MSDTEDRLQKVELELERVRRIVQRLMTAAFPSIIYPLINNDATDEQIDGVLAFLENAAKDAAAGHGVTAAAFSDMIVELLPNRASHAKLPGLLVTWCYFTEDLRPLYVHLRESGLEGIDRAVESAVAGEG